MHEIDKQGILDVRILMNNNTEIDIEIQLSPLNVWADRSLFYLSKMYTDQIEQGQSYTVFKKCVSISILDFKLFQDTEEFYSCFHILEDTRHTLYTDKMEFHVLELPKLPKELKEDANDRLLWGKFISAETKEEFDMLASKNEYINSAYEQLQVISQDKQKQMEYTARMKAELDYKQGMLEARQQREKIGEQRGRQETRTSMVIKMLQKGFDIDTITELSQLSISEIEELKKNI